MEIFVPKSSSLILLHISLEHYTKAGVEGEDEGEKMYTGGMSSN